MPTLSSALAMDGDNYLHPEGPQLDVSMFPVASSNMEGSLYGSSDSWRSFSQPAEYSAHSPMQSGNHVDKGGMRFISSHLDVMKLLNLGHSYGLGCLLLPAATQATLPPRLPPLCFAYASRSVALQYHLTNATTNSSTTTTPDVNMDIYSGFPLDFSGLNLPRNGDFSQSHTLSSRDEQNALRNTAESPEGLAGRAPQTAVDEELMCPAAHGPMSLMQIWTKLYSQLGRPLPKYTDTQAFISTDSLTSVPTIWDVNTSTTSPPAATTIGISHPDIVVETNTLSSVPPPDITYTVSIYPSTINSGMLSQHEVILQNNQRAGFLIGDGAGVGKGRTVAGIILENYLKGRKKSLWFSISNDLRFDAERDLKDIDATHIPVHALNKIKYGDTATSEGVLFATYSALIGESQAGGQHRTRIKQILDWCKADFDGVIIFDECHKAKNATSTKMGKAVLDLQNKLPRARVVYASATGASEPKNMIYMSRLGIWGEGTPFKTFDDFLHAIEKRGVGAMEIVAMDMKVSGMYIARQLSFSGVSFRIEEIGLDNDFKQVYNKAARLWAEALQIFMRAADELGLVSRKSLWGQFWSSHQRFFKYLCIAAKVRCLVELAQKELEAGKCIVVGLQSTGEARTREVLDENDGQLDRFVSAAEGVFYSLVLKHFPSEKQRREKAPGNKRKRKPRSRQPKLSKHTVDSGGVINISDDSSSDSDGMDTDSNSSPESLLDNDDVIFVNHTSYTAARIEDMKQGLLNKISLLGKELPLNTLDELIDKFGGPEKVSEMTGRKGRVVRRPDGVVRYESRAEQGHTIDHINVKEKDRFMNAEKLVAIISEAASSGISLQADKRVRNQRRRVHMTLELPWSADRAIQQFGRTHRSNQVTAPEYIFLISELGGERRFASIVAKRLESLGALTHGDRRATESRDLSKYNFENKYGTKALDKITKAILGHIENKVPPPKDYPGGESLFFRDMKIGMTDVGIFYCSITKFLNRILGLEVHKQNHLFQYFMDNFDYLIEKDKKEGKYDMGILDLAPGNDEIYEEKQENFLTAGNPQDGQVVLYKAQKLSRPDEGFYLSHKLRGNHPCVLLAEQGRGKNFIIYKPNIGKQNHPESLDNLQLRYRKVTQEEAQDSWENQFTFSFKKCSHANWNGKCKKIEEGQECLQGMRLRQYHMLCGALLRVWKRVADTVADVTSTSILQIVRLKTKQHNKQVGIKIPENCVARVREELIQMDEEVKKRRKEKEQQALEQQQADERQRKMTQANRHLIGQNHIMNQSLTQNQALGHKPQNQNPLQRTQPHSFSQLQRGKGAHGQTSLQRVTQNMARLPALRNHSQIQPRTQNNRPNNSTKGALGSLPSMATLSSHFPQFSPQPFMSSFPSLKSHALTSQALQSNPSSSSISSSKNPLGDILDLTMSPSPSPDSTEGGLGLGGLAGPAGVYRDEFALESLISPNALGLHQRSAHTPHQPSPLLRQLQQPRRQQQQQESLLVNNNSNQTDFLEFLDPSFSMRPHPSSTSSAGPVPHGAMSHVARGPLSASLVPPSSPSSSLFSSGASPSSLFSSPPACLLSPPEPLPSLPNGHCGSPNALDVREALTSMLLAGNDRKSVIQYRLPE
ncbi:hypothetical protein NHX12_033190 [Muraenolepis orangiensis]|uniref:Protein strawberry notch homolog 2 n=1 Tax=Muraenolepis orangiensis TaxID=630683 RepID=A0A9Q0E200_9TELE|nr:hypothetical protein NHX12_033190 [Muraenolepis orangiensis]